ncbi:zinc phosphodiesterase elac protein 2 [Phtheirospermum japonicum]|uniref:ribonuclease Z n=1 Tax=Phtheirospermum japonicum TaxID=374723 RepID=A0A830BCA8_9LAMI|nr:zinc phosphodiesterase elac protein 2 [Phtheirospermum japonicum]
MRDDKTGASNRKSINPVNTASYVQILGNGMDTQDTSSSVLLFFDQQRFIFNAGEGFQRYCVEYKMKMSKINQIFLSRVCSETALGLPGLLLTLSGIDHNVKVWGPKDLEYLVDAMKHFVPDNLLTKHFDWPGRTQDSPRKIDDHHIIINNEIKGKFDPEKAKSLGLKPGPKCGRLQRGLSVKSDLMDIMIHPNDVIEPSVPGPIVVLIDCPTLLHFQELLNDEREGSDIKRKCKNGSTTESRVSPSKKQKAIETIREENCVQDDVVVTKRPRLNHSAIPGCMEDIRRDDMEIVFLGTGSSQPSKYRNVSSIFLNLFSKGSMLLDCGEATLGQLKRRFGIEGADEAVSSLRCIWISHIHADHHAGLASVLAQRRDLLTETPHDPLIVIGPTQLKYFLDDYQKLEHLDMQFLDCERTKEPHLDGQPILESLKKVLVEAGLETLVSVPVEHCERAYGVVLKAVNRVNRVGKMIPGWKLVYSGDTRPCDKLIRASEGATVLIHEATFEDGLSHEAKAKRHSTTSEALKVGDLCGVYRLILTHFSQRYPEILELDETPLPDNTCVAFDLMSVNLADLCDLGSAVMEDLKHLFEDKMAKNKVECTERLDGAKQF